MDIDGAVPFENHTLTAFRNVYPKDIRCDSREEQVNHSLYFECKTFLHGLLVVEDKMSMAHSLETRVPLLDNELVDLACQTPVRYKIANLHEWKTRSMRTPHAPERSVLNGQIRVKTSCGKRWDGLSPKRVTQAKKQGFSGPDESWFRSSSEKYVRDLLLDNKARINEYLNPEYVRQVIEIHNSGVENKRLLIWSLLSFEWWLKAVYHMKILETIPCPDSRDPDLSGLSVGSDSVLLVDFLGNVWCPWFVFRREHVNPIAQ